MVALRHVLAFSLCALILQGCANSGGGSGSGSPNTLTYYGENLSVTPMCGAGQPMGSACGGYSRDGRGR
jgi:hypothetical protein